MNHNVFTTNVAKYRVYLMVLIVLLALLMLFTAVNPYREDAARYVWENYKLDRLALFLDAKDAPFAKDIGDYYFNVKGSGVHDLNKALNAYRRALELDSEIKEVHYQIGRIYFIQGDLFRAPLEIKKEMERNPELPNTHYVLGLIYGFRGWVGDLDKAETEFATFIEKVPGNWAGYNDLAWIYIRRGKNDEAKQTIDLAFERLPYLKKTNVWLWTALGIVYLHTDYYNEARESFLTAEKIASSMTPEYFWSAYPGNDSRNAETAFRQFRSALNFNLGVTDEKLGKPKEAIQYYKEYLALLPKGPFPEKEAVEKKIDELNVQAQ